MGRNSYYLCEKDHPVKTDLFGSHISDMQSVFTRYFCSCVCVCFHLVLLAQGLKSASSCKTAPHCFVVYVFPYKQYGRSSY